jgi:Ca2+/H+ antiporter
LSGNTYVRYDANKAQPPGDSALNQGFLGTAAPRYADLLLLLEVAMGFALLVGALLARLRRFRAHAVCQSAVVLLNAAIIVLIMLPSFRVHVAPKIPRRLGKAYYALSTAHAALGTVAECAALYILVAAGTNLLPENLRITRYKLWMRAVLVGWWLVVLLGFATYARWYIPNLLPR